MKKDVFLTPSDRREGQRWVLCLYLVCVVSHAALRVRFPVCSEGSKVGLLVVSVIHIFLPLITQSVHYKTISATYVVGSKILHYSDTHLEADQWLNRKEWRLGSGRRRQLSQDRIDR